MRLPPGSRTPEIMHIWKPSIVTIVYNMRAYYSAARLKHAQINEALVAGSFPNYAGSDSRTKHGSKCSSMDCENLYLFSYCMLTSFYHPYAYQYRMVGNFRVFREPFANIKIAKFCCPRAKRTNRISICPTCNYLAANRSGRLQVPLTAIAEAIQKT